jgi:transposase
MSDMPKHAKLAILSYREHLIKQHLEKGKTITELARFSGISRDTLHRWKKQYIKMGNSGLLPHYRAPNNSPNKTNDYVVQLIRKIRKTKPRFGARKIQIRLEKQYGIKMSWQGIHKVLKREGMIYHRKRIPRKDKFPKRNDINLPGQLVQIDVKYVPEPIENKRYYQFTAIDVATRLRFLKMYPSMGNHITMDFVKAMKRYFSFSISAIQTDNAGIFTNRYTGYQKSADPMKPRLHVLDIWCQENNIDHYLIDKGKPQQNSHVERSHRTDNEEFFFCTVVNSYIDLQQKSKKFLHWYNYEREHLGINGLTPHEKYLELSKIN